jgi:SAM-dependent methyltransferase
MIRNYFAKARERSWKIYSKYYAHNGYRHHEARYLEEVTRHVFADSLLLDAGAGTDMVFTRQVAPKVRMAVGTDISELRTVASGPYGVRADLCKLPFKDKVFDIVFLELSRVLKPGAVAVIQTPNKYDYVSFIARLTPLWFHQRVLLRLLDRKEEDTFPTFFNANSRKRIIALLTRSNLVPSKVVLFNQYPAYLMFSPFLFRLGILYERLTSRFDICAQLRGWILVVAQKRVNA